MICKQNEAKVHLTQIVDGKIKKVDICEECSKAKGIDDSTGASLADLLLGLGASQELAQTSGGTDLSCPKCGFTHADFKKSGRLGCPECYQTFAEGLEGLLKSMHKGTHHVGKVPRVLQQTKLVQDRLQALQRRLEEAIAKENYEQAARLRDEIKQLKEETGGVVAV